MHNRRTTHHARTTAAALAVLAGAVAAPSAQAAEEPAESGARHCVTDAGTGQQSCYATFTEAVSAASGGRITDASASARDAARDSGFRAETRQFNTSAEARAKADGVIQGTFFDDPGFGGDSLTITGEGLCKKDGVVNYQHDLEDAWKNRVSSVQPWGDCWVWLYPEPNLGGDRDGPFKENASDIGSMMNDRTQSIGFS